MRDIAKVHAWDPSPENLAAFRDVVTGLGLDFVAETERQAAVRAADVLITVTPSQKALVDRAWVRPGTHISAMGADTKGKQELDPELVAAASVFVDEAAQAVSIGECQHAHAAGLLDESDIKGAIGAVIAGTLEGRRTPDEITLFDGTGVALQDLVVANLAVRLATAQRCGNRCRLRIESRRAESARRPGLSAQCLAQPPAIHGRSSGWPGPAISAMPPAV